MAEFEVALPVGQTRIMACQALGLKLFVLLSRSPKLNGHVEGMQRSFREEFYTRPLPSQIPELQRELDAYLEHYNRRRPHRAWGGLTLGGKTRWSRSPQSLRCVGRLHSKQVFAGKHDAPVLAVLNRSVDAAATFANDDRNKSGAWTQFLKPEEAAQITAIFYSRPIPGDTFSVSKQFLAKYPNLTKGIAAAIQRIRTPESKLLFNLYRIDYMVPAKDSDYDVVREARKIAGQ